MLFNDFGGWVSKNGRKTPTPDELREHRWKMFLKDGLSPEERLLCHIFGEKSAKGLPKEKRDRATFDVYDRQAYKISKDGDEINRLIAEEFFDGEPLVHCGEKEVDKIHEEWMAGKLSVADLAKKYGINEKQMAFVLNYDCNQFPLGLVAAFARVKRQMRLKKAKECIEELTKLFKRYNPENCINRTLDTDRKIAERRQKISRKTSEERNKDMTKKTSAKKPAAKKTVAVKKPVAPAKKVAKSAVAKKPAAKPAAKPAVNKTEKKPAPKVSKPRLVVDKMPLPDGGKLYVKTAKRPVAAKKPAKTAKFAKVEKKTPAKKVAAKKRK